MHSRWHRCYVSWLKQNHGTVHFTPSVKWPTGGAQDRTGNPVGTQFSCTWPIGHSSISPPPTWRANASDVSTPDSTMYTLIKSKHKKCIKVSQYQTTVTMTTPTYIHLFPQSLYFYVPFSVQFWLEGFITVTHWLQEIPPVTLWLKGVLAKQPAFSVSFCRISTFQPTLAHTNGCERSGSVHIWKLLWVPYLFSYIFLFNKW